MYSYGPPHLTEQKQGDQLEPTYSSSEDTGCSPEYLPEAMNDREEWWEGQGYPYGRHDMMMMMMMIYIWWAP